MKYGIFVCFRQSKYVCFAQREFLCQFLHLFPKQKTDWDIEVAACLFPHYIFVIVQFVDERTAINPINTNDRKELAKVAFISSIN